MGLSGCYCDRFGSIQASETEAVGVKPTADRQRWNGLGRVTTGVGQCATCLMRLARQFWRTSLRRPSGAHNDGLIVGLQGDVEPTLALNPLSVMIRARRNRPIGHALKVRDLKGRPFFARSSIQALHAEVQLRPVPMGLAHGKPGKINALNGWLTELFKVWRIKNTRPVALVANPARHHSSVVLSPGVHLV